VRGPSREPGFPAHGDVAGLIAVAHTLPYDMEVAGPGNLLPRRDWRDPVPTLVIVGTASMPWMLPGTRRGRGGHPRGRHLELAGEDHGTPGSHPDALLQPLVEFFG